jgi:hypothetical protein
MTKSKVSSGWSLIQIEATKKAVKSALDRDELSNAPTLRLNAALEEIAVLVEDDTPTGRLQRYIYIMSALVHHERHGGLSNTEIDKLVNLAYSILQAHGIRPRSSRAASLYGDLHLIRSQIYRKEGNSWKAAWEQQVALLLTGKSNSTADGLQNFIMGNRYLRLGDSVLAARMYEQSIKETLSLSQLGRARFGLLQCNWLSGQAFHVELARTEESWPADVISEFSWHALVRRCLTSQDFSPMLSETKKTGHFYDATYIIEACFWCLAIENRSYIDRLPKLESMRRNKNLQPQRLNLWYEAARTLQQCYDYQIPLDIRLRTLSAVIDKRKELISIDKELLLLAAATRWLARSKVSSVALLVFSEYRALSLRLSGGKCQDALNILCDMRERDWMNALIA